MRPTVAVIKVSKDQDYCGETIVNETYLIDSNGGLKNVVVSLEDAPVSSAADPQKVNIIENNACRLLVNVGTTFPECRVIAQAILG